MARFLFWLNSHSIGGKRDKNEKRVSAMYQERYKIIDRLPRLMILKSGEGNEKRRHVNEKYQAGHGVVILRSSRHRLDGHHVCLL